MFHADERCLNRLQVRVYKDYRPLPLHHVGVGYHVPVGDDKTCSHAYGTAVIHQDIDHSPFHERCNFPSPFLEENENIRFLLLRCGFRKCRRNEKKGCGKDKGTGDRLCIGSVEWGHDCSSLVIFFQVHGIPRELECQFFPDSGRWYIVFMVI